MKTALVILDMLNDFVDGTLANPAAKEIIDPIAHLVNEARRQDDWVVVYANDAHQPNDLEFAVFGEHALAGTEGAQVIPELTPSAEDIVVPKRFYSAFTDTDLDATCRVHGIERMVIVGQHTNCCCRHTSYDAFRRGIELAVVADGTCVYEPLTDGEYERFQREALSYLNTFYNADIVDAAEVF